MACPTCDHTMENVSAFGNSGRRFWCPRCGTLKDSYESGEDTVGEPKLIEAVLELLKHCRDDPYMRSFKSAVEECCRLPAERKYSA